MDKNKDQAIWINEHCLCKTLDKVVLEKELATHMGDDFFLKNHANMFAQTAVFISRTTLSAIEELIQKIESAIGSESFQNEVTKNLPDSAAADFGPAGVFMGYDFHLTDSGPKLIEINTNAGGALLNLYLARAQVACCRDAKTPFSLDSLEEKYFQMFLNEWRLQRGEAKLQTIVILDELPREQFLYPEFKLFVSLFNKFGLEAFILDPAELDINEEGVWYGEKRIDFIYNRLTDFYFEQSAHQPLKKAYLKQNVVVSPNPHHHATHANKHNLEWLCRLPTLSAGIPYTEKVSPEHQQNLWQNRRGYFFKPAKRYGSKAAYRGDKMTLKVWDEINPLDYVAQEIVKPSERLVELRGGQSHLKLDLRAYVYQGKVQLLASRLYAGQTTNFRSEGGGFAPVFLI